MSITASGQVPIRVTLEFGDWSAQELTTLTYEQVANMREGVLEDQVFMMLNRLHTTFLQYRGKG